MRALIVEPDAGTVALLAEAMAGHGIACEHAETADDALDLARHYDYDVVTVEPATQAPPSGRPAPGLAPGDPRSQKRGWHLVKGLRTTLPRCGIIVITRDAGPENVVLGLAAGADDYLSKPFHKAELIARIYALARRARQGSTSRIVEVGPLRVDIGGKRTTVGGEPLHLTGKEYALIELLAMRCGQVVHRHTILDHMYGSYLDEPVDKIVAVYICKVRKKLAAAPGDLHWIETVWGIGYRMQGDGG